MIREIEHTKALPISHVRSTCNRDVVNESQGKAAFWHGELLSGAAGSLRCRHTDELLSSLGASRWWTTRKPLTVPPLAP
jgi:hypothetical protein